MNRNERLCSREARLVEGAGRGLWDRQAKSCRPSGACVADLGQGLRGRERRVDTGGAPPPSKPQVGRPTHSLADVLRVQLFAAGPALETAQVPVFVQGHQGLAVLDLGSAAPATWKKERSTDVILPAKGAGRGARGAGLGGAPQRWDVRPTPRGQRQRAGQRGASGVEGGRYYTTADVTMWKTNPEAHSCMH